jgi:hypothetical protein
MEACLRASCSALAARDSVIPRAFHGRDMAAALAHLRRPLL